MLRDNSATSLSPGRVSCKLLHRFRHAAFHGAAHPGSFNYEADSAINRHLTSTLMWMHTFGFLSFTLREMLPRIARDSR
jgi:hypothetical protein